jgi:hypothetical protein
MVSQLHRFVERTQAIGREQAFIDLVLTDGFRPLTRRRERSAINRCCASSSAGSRAAQRSAASIAPVGSPAVCFASHSSRHAFERTAHTELAAHRPSFPKASSQRGVRAVEKGTVIQPHGRIEVASLESVRKLVRVAANLTGNDKLVRR